jgi:hypothetical protein
VRPRTLRRGSGIVVSSQPRENLLSGQKSEQKAPKPSTRRNHTEAGCTHAMLEHRSPPSLPVCRRSRRYRHHKSSRSELHPRTTEAQTTPSPPACHRARRCWHRKTEKPVAQPMSHGERRDGCPAARRVLLPEPLTRLTVLACPPGWNTPAVAITTSLDGRDRESRMGRHSNRAHGSTVRQTQSALVRRRCSGDTRDYHFQLPQVGRSLPARSVRQRLSPLGKG